MKDGCVLCVFKTHHIVENQFRHPLQCTVTGRLGTRFLKLNVRLHLASDRVPILFFNQGVTPSSSGSVVWNASQFPRNALGTSLHD